MTTEILTFLAPNSASPTIMAKGKYNGNPAYYKIFYNDSDPTKKNKFLDALLYEAEVYKYISGQEEKYKKFFINLFSSENTTLQTLVTNSIIKNSNDPILQKRMADLNIYPTTIVHMIITEDTKSESLSDFISKLTDIYVNNNYVKLKKILSNIFDLVLQGIYILNKKLNIQHNDMHFGNILIKENTTYYSNKKYNLKSNYKISIYDFDRSYYYGHDNRLLNDLCPSGNGCNSLSYKDLFVFIQVIIYNYYIYETKAEYSLLFRYLSEVIQSIIPREHIRILLSNMKDILSKKIGKSGLHWSAYCAHLDMHGLPDINFPCSKTEEQDKFFPWLSTLYERFFKFSEDVRENEKIFYYKKYLKYKNKYLSLKNKN